MTTIVQISDGISSEVADWSQFRSYPKLMSSIVLASLGLPVLDTIVVRDFSSSSLMELKRILASRAWQQVTVRNDGQGSRFLEGGITVTFDEFLTIAESSGFRGLFFLLEPTSALRNGYNVSILDRGEECDIEVVGPGFDTSDLQRGHQRPHQTLSYDLRRKRFQTTSVISQVEYELSRHERISKIQRKYVAELRRNNVIASTWPPASYEELPVRILNEFIRPWLEVRHPLATIFSVPFVLSGSQLLMGERVAFWDVFSAKYG